MMIAGTHDSALMVLSILIAMAASYTALDLASRTRASTGLARKAWLGTSAVAMGGGIWAMHFVGMLAFSVPGMEVSYDLGLTLLSLALAIGATGLSFMLVSRAEGSLPLLLASGLLMGLGIVAMHYVGMAAMKMPADLRHARLWVAVAVLIAIGAATVALWLSVQVSRMPMRACAAVVMGFAVSGMHYAGMQGAAFTAHSNVDAAHGWSSLNQVTLALAVATSTFLILFLSLVAAMFDRRFALLAEREAVALRESRERFRALYQRTPLPLHSLDAEGRIEDVTEAWLGLMGYGRDEVVGRPLINFMTEASARQFMHQDWPALLKAGELREVEYRVVTRAGDFRDVLASARVERAEEGGLLRVLGGLADVTERRRTEEALRQSQKIESIGQLTGGVAHDFNNLLAVVMGNLELLRKRLPEDPKAAALLENALQGVRRGASLTQRLLAFARKQNLTPSAVDVPDLVRGMAEMLRRSIGPMVRIDTHFPLELPPAHVDANQLELAVLNLAVNARDAMPEGGTLTISADQAELAPGASEGLKPGRYVLLSVTDTGMGMDAATLARAAEPFFTTKGIGKGTGLGLPMAQGLAAQSGGRLLLRSELGRGTTCEIWLPAAEPEPRGEAAVSAPPVPAPPTPLSILVVDDDALVLANSVAMLEDLGHRVVPASSGAEALAQLGAGHDFDLVVTDQVMPGITGMQLVAALRTLHPGMPVLLVSGYADLPAEAQGHVLRLGKPFDQAALAQAVAAATQPTGARIIALDERRITGPRAG
ncbi:response regulator [Roseomonas sp. SSH11]|uniref:histidine kinase n=1 Tax=Pararoseomonas baculiformis TaxID=2820812 RepID=A0ABS4AJG7_9PROT|nr:MHYT domain-containing protein [Pararoseomonas baculiformis]MBP0447162.1 response regulator [Pararoseomonas baculiformis]